MKVSAIKNLKRKLLSGQPVVGLWITLESPSITEMAVALGLDWIVIDAEHGHLDWKEIVEHLRATVRSDTVALVRIAECNIGLVKRALDIGADGLVLPWMETAEQLREVARYALYPPEGIRGIGTERATGWGQCFIEHVMQANENVLIVPMIESTRGGENIREMVGVPNVEMFFLGPADYSSSAGFAGQWQGPGVAEKLLQIKDCIVAAGKHCGVMATDDEDLLRRRSQGFRLLGIGADSGLLLRSLHRSLECIQRDRKIDPEFLSSDSPGSAPMKRPPESFRPDRPEVVTEIGSGSFMELQPGIVFECMVGKHNHSKGLTTGIVRFEPAASLARHTHPCTESITLLKGAASVEIAGRCYQLTPLDNVVVPASLPHAVKNESSDEPAEFHIAFPTSAPTRDIVAPCPLPQRMPDGSTGPRDPGAERVNRFHSARRFDAGPGATFIDFFNDDLMPGLEMSGGYGLFFPEGRLPTHIHDFDESICITEGQALCVVEGRNYLMSNFSTALQPRGRVHYFRNDSQKPMAMIWVYAGPKPERLLVDEHNTTKEGNPWN